MRHITESAAGRREGPLPSAVPRDEDHIETPRDLRAEALAAKVKGQAETKQPLTIAEQVERVTQERKETE